MGINVGMPIATDPQTITPQILSLIAEIDEFKGASHALVPVTNPVETKLHNERTRHGR